MTQLGARKELCGCWSPHANTDLVKPYVTGALHKDQAAQKGNCVSFLESHETGGTKLMQLVMTRLCSGAGSPSGSAGGQQPGAEVERARKDGPVSGNGNVVFAFPFSGSRFLALEAALLSGLCL